MKAYHGGKVDEDGGNFDLSVLGGGVRKKSMEEVEDERRKEYRSGVIAEMRKKVMQDFENMPFDQFAGKYPLQG